jgi:hypothetical protein
MHPLQEWEPLVRSQDLPVVPNADLKTKPALRIYPEVIPFAPFFFVVNDGDPVPGIRVKRNPSFDSDLAIGGRR